VFELTVVMKDSERTYRQKFLCYDPITLSTDNVFILECIDEAKKNFQGQPEDVSIKISMEI
jgi:hypothetical protein